MMLVASSFLAHYSAYTVTANGRYFHTRFTRFAGIISIILRKTGKILAALNAAWIVAACLFQFSSFFDRCLCNSSVFSLGTRAYNAIDLLPSDIAGLKAPWIGGVALASGEQFVDLFGHSFSTQLGARILDPLHGIRQRSDQPGAPRLATSLKVICASASWFFRRCRIRVLSVNGPHIVCYRQGFLPVLSVVLFLPKLWSRCLVLKYTHSLTATTLERVIKPCGLKMQNPILYTILTS